MNQIKENGMNPQSIDYRMKPNRQIEKPDSTKWQCAVLKDNTYASLSPFIHGEGYRAVGIQNDFAYSEISISPSELATKIKEFKNPLHFYRGISVGVPFKGEEGVMRRENGTPVFLDAVDEAAEKIGAVNTIVVERKQGKTTLLGTNTDVIGFIDSIKENGVEISGKKVIVFGAGGASRASIYGALKEGALKVSVAVRNKDSDKAKKTADLFKDDPRVQFITINGSEVSSFDIIVNTVPTGHHERPVVPVSGIRPGQTVVEWKYSKDLPETELEIDASKKGALVVSGREILLHQAKGQFELFTGKKAPIDQMRKAIETATTA